MRVQVPLTENAWVTLGTAEMIIEVENEGDTGVVYLSNSGQNTSAPLTIGKGTAGWQYSNTKATDTIDAFATGPDWILTVDI